MKQIVLILTILISGNLQAQDYKFRENINKDSLFNASIKKFPEEMREEFIKTYKEGNEQTKEFILFMISMPESSKKELVENYENKKAEITKLKEEYLKYVPKDHIVEIEFEPENQILTVPEEITIKIYRIKDKNDKLEDRNTVQRNDNLEIVSQNWNLRPGSKELDEVLKLISWTNGTLAKIKQLLENANCVSIGNGTVTTIGFARSGMGKYFYKIFEKDLTAEQKKNYNDGCHYIYYKDNVVLEYGGGAVGPQCFEKE